MPRERTAAVFIGVERLAVVGMVGLVVARLRYCLCPAREIGL